MAPPLVIGGHERPIHFTLDAIILAEDTIQYPIRPLITRHRALTVSQIITLCWACWRADERNLSTAKVRAWVHEYCANGGTVLELENAVVDALVESGILLPRQEDDDDARPPMTEPAPSLPAATATS